jgi:membrane-associated PAP2 superfamily phosphatase
VLAVFAEYSGLDLRIAHQFYDGTAGHWPYRSLFLTEKVLHDWAQTLVKIAGGLTTVLLAASFALPRLKPYRRVIGYFLLATATGPLIVGLLKGLTHIQTPWELAQFGGDMPYIRLFDAVPDGIPIGHAFPGGHSSGGFAFFSLYFLLYYRAHRYRFFGLAVPLLLGTVFAVTQEIRGAHFLSHDLFSLAVCWTSALAWSLAFRRLD